MASTSLGEFYNEFMKLQKAYHDAIADGKHKDALEIGEKMLTLLIDTLKQHIIPNLADPISVKIVQDILHYHELELAYVRGLKEGSLNLPVVYSFQAVERALNTLTRNIEQLYSFVLGALVILNDVASRAAKEHQKETRSYMM